MTEQQKTRLYINLEKIRLRYDALFFKRLQRFYLDESILLITRLKVNQSASLDSFYETRNTKLYDLLYGLYESCIREFYQFQENLNTSPEYKKAVLDLETKASFRQTVAEIKFKIQSRVQAITNTSKARTEALIASGKNVIDNVRVWYTNPGRIMRQARTEVNTASNVGLQEAAKSYAGFTTKIWISRRDNLVRETHVEIDGEERPIDEIYSNGCYFPGDINGPPSEVINCRCFQIFK